MITNLQAAHEAKEASLMQQMEELENDHTRVLAAEAAKYKSLEQVLGTTKQKLEHQLSECVVILRLSFVTNTITRTLHHLHHHHASPPPPHPPSPATYTIHMHGTSTSNDHARTRTHTRTHTDVLAHLHASFTAAGTQNLMRFTRARCCRWSHALTSRRLMMSMERLSGPSKHA
jgi:hypothetical protein